ncbi:MAG: zinc ribbon domain-containing protein [Trichodesmium sp. St18_bin1]|nr:zinc ribbon domain-containing protein [Trichodesmium sp. St18_bin1]MDE5120524.1 zinc ribbon domain-containing protein [Trichodesmium sp. St19_bin1]
MFSSSKTCSNCAHVLGWPLKVRSYDCRECKLSIDRDLNASINLRKGVGNSEVSNDRQTHSGNVVGSRVNACG